MHGIKSNFPFSSAPQAGLPHSQKQKHRRCAHNLLEAENIIHRIGQDSHARGPGQRILTAGLQAAVYGSQHKAYISHRSQDALVDQYGQPFIVGIGQHQSAEIPLHHAFQRRINTAVDILGHGVRTHAHQLPRQVLI